MPSDQDDGSDEYLNDLASEEARRARQPGPLTPSPSLLAKLGSLIVHAQEAVEPGGHHLDLAAVQGLLEDPEVAEWLDGMHGLSMLPVRR